MILLIDLFCGAGGVSIGASQARNNKKRAVKIMAAVNHDELAIKSHQTNHVEVHHFVEDIRTLDVSLLVAIVAKHRVKYPKFKVVIWASVDCTHFSVSAGGNSRNGDSRTLCDHLERYVKPIDPDYLMIENVREFRSNGPIRIKAKTLHNDRSELAIDKNGNYIFVPDKRYSGSFFNKWIQNICSLGYDYQDRDINSADFGEYTKRIRYYAQFAKKGMPIVWPEATHDRAPMPGSKLKKWKPVKEVLDFSNEGKSIFNRKKPLGSKTLERIYLGLQKYIGSPTNQSEKIDYQSKDNINFLSLYYSGNPYSKNISIHEPARTIITVDHHYLVTIKKASITEPLYFLDRQFSRGTKHSSIDQPAGTILTVPKMSLVRAEHYCGSQSFNGIIQYDESNQAFIPILSSDCTYTILIKKFMTEYGISDIKIRGLVVDELKKIQGFPVNYYLAGSQRHQKKFIGNSCTPKVCRAIFEATSKRLIDYETYAITKVAA